MPPSGPPVIARESLQGKYAGCASRFTAFAADAGISAGVYMLALAAISFAALALPLSFLFPGLGFAGILPGEPAPGAARRDRRDGGHLLLGRAGSAAAVPVREVITQPRLARAGFFIRVRPVPGSSSGLVRVLSGYRVGVLDGDPGAFWP